MATITTNGGLEALLTLEGSGQGASGPAIAEAARVHRRRYVSPNAGRAIEMLGHAIDYLADEFALDCVNGRRQFAGDIHPQIEAIEILKSRNREVYFDCPEVPAMSEKLRSLLRFQKA